MFRIYILKIQSTRRQFHPTTHLTAFQNLRDPILTAHITSTHNLNFTMANALLAAHNRADLYSKLYHPSQFAATLSGSRFPITVIDNPIKDYKTPYILCAPITTIGRDCPPTRVLVTRARDRESILEEKREIPIGSDARIAYETYRHPSEIRRCMTFLAVCVSYMRDSMK